jgi:hypothetical protein
MAAASSVGSESCLLTDIPSLRSLGESVPRRSNEGSLVSLGTTTGRVKTDGEHPQRISPSAHAPRFVKFHRLALVEQVCEQLSEQSLWFDF